MVVDLVDVLRRCLPAIGPLALFVAVVRVHRGRSSRALSVCALALAVTVVASAVAAWLGLRFDVSHELPAWYNQVYWWSTQWVVPLGYAVAGLSLLVSSAGIGGRTHDRA